MHLSEGDIMKRFSTIVCVLISIILVLFLGGCQKNPAERVITSKNDGSFDISSAISASENCDEITTYEVQYDEFFSTDKTVKFTFAIDDVVSIGNTPIIEVSPHYLSEEEIKHIAQVLFGDSIIYEAERTFSPVYSKSEILKKINRWSQYANSEALQTLYGVSMDHMVTLIQDYIERYTLLYESASDENPHQLCDWNFRKAMQYMYSEEQLVTEGIDISDDNDEIKASLFMNEIEYIYSASTRNKDDFKLNYITAYPYSGISPGGIDALILRANLCRTAEPTEYQVSQMHTSTENYLQKMGLGEWEIDQCYVNKISYGETPEYTICVTAVPTLDGVAATRRPQLEDLKSENVYASNYYLTDALFEFSANGELMLFRLYSPIEIKQIINKNAAILSLDELIQKAKTYFAHSDYFAYGFASEIEQSKEKFGCTVEVNDVDYGLTRVKVPNSDESYYYVPSITLRGNVEYYIKASAEICYENNNETLLILNAVDGSIINLTNE